MFEESNPIQEEENVFSDVTEEENLFEDVEETPEAPEAEEVHEEPKAFLRVKYNGEEKDLNEDETRTFAQKGMNYDRIYEPLEKLARMNNMSVGDYLNQLNETQIQYEVSVEMDRLRQEPRYENVSDEVLEEIANSRVKANVDLQNRQYEDSLRAEADAREQMIKRDVDHFLNEYPQFKGEGYKNIDEKVFEYVRQGYTLLEAYSKFERESSANKISQQNEANKRRSLGSTTNASKAESDDFLKGFLNG